MNKTILFALTILIFLLQLTSCETHQKDVELNKLELRDSLWYEKNSNELFTGRYFEKYANGKLKGIIKIKKGKVNGQTEKYFENGVKESEIHYQNGVLHGKSVEWFENGQLSGKAYFHKGKLDGYSEKYFENGAYDGYSYYTMGELDSLFRFFINGNKKVELRYFDGMDNSLFHEWDSTGVLIDSWGFKDGELILFNE